MKLADRYRLEGLARRREVLLDALEFTSPGYTGNGLGITIRGTYQGSEVLDRCRPSIHAVFTGLLAELDAELAAMGVEP